MIVALYKYKRCNDFFNLDFHTSRDNTYSPADATIFGFSLDRPSFPDFTRDKSNPLDLQNTFMWICCEFVMHSTHRVVQLK